MWLWARNELSTSDQRCPVGAVVAHVALGAISAHIAPLVRLAMVRDRPHLNYCLQAGHSDVLYAMYACILR